MGTLGWPAEMYHAAPLQVQVDGWRWVDGEKGSIHRRWEEKERKREYVEWVERMVSVLLFVQYKKS